MFNNTYQVEPHLAGRSVELTFDPFDLTRIDVLCDGQPAGVAAPLVIGRHSHPRATPEIPEAMPVPATGIDYLALIDAARDGEVARTVNYAALIHTHDEHDEQKPTDEVAAGIRVEAEHQPDGPIPVESGVEA
jgi:putative transposase